RVSGPPVRGGTGLAPEEADPLREVAAERSVAGERPVVAGGNGATGLVRGHPQIPPQNRPGASTPEGSKAALRRRWISIADGGAPRPPGPRITGAIPPSSAA